MKLHQFINQDGQNKISEAVKTAEDKTSGEIVPMIVSKSDAYPGARWRFTLAFLLVMSIALHFSHPQILSAHPLGILLALVILGEILGKIPFFNKLALLQKEVDDEVFERAVLEFSNQKIAKTKMRTGIFIFVSLFEHKVVVLADEGIHAKVKPGTWNELVQNLIAAIKKKEIVAGFCAAIETCGFILAKHFPAETQNRNELADHLIIKE